MGKFGYSKKFPYLCSIIKTNRFMAKKKRLIQKIAGMLGSDYRTLTDEERTELFSELTDRRIFGFKPVVRVWFDYDNRGHVWDEVGEMGGSEGYYYADILEPLATGEIISAMPYFRPIGSMTDEERADYAEMFSFSKEVDYDFPSRNHYDDEVYSKSDIFRFFYERNLDMWNLCERGLAKPVFHNLAEFIKCKKRAASVEKKDSGRYNAKKIYFTEDEDGNVMVSFDKVCQYLRKKFESKIDEDGDLCIVNNYYNSVEELIEDLREVFGFFEDN